MLGTISLKEKQLFEKICKAFPGKIAVGVDAKNGFVTTEGWAKTSKVKVLDIIKQYEDSGVSTIIFTDIDKDGVLEGVSFDQLQTILSQTSIKVIASGGVSDIEDLKKLKKLSKTNKNLDGVIVGRAIYEKRVDVKKAIEILK